MLNFKKTAVAVLAISSGAAFAGTMGPVCSAVNVTVPCENTAWDIGGKALYFQPSLDGNRLASENSFYSPIGTGNTTFGKNPQYAWGFFLEGSYHFNTGNDLNLNWYHINKSNHRTFDTVGPISNGIVDIITDVIAGPGSEIGVVGAPASVSVSPHWDAVNLEFGQHVDFGEFKSIRFHGGAQYARLTGKTSVNGDFTLTQAGVPVFGPIDFAFAAAPTYNGFGPRVGADLAYDWDNGLGIYATAASALLAGSSKYSNSFTSFNPPGFSASGSKTLVVPELEGKLGIDYTYALAQGDLTLDAGWMWINYFNVLQNDGLINPTTNGNFGLQGVYFGLKWLGNVA